ncbi:MAG: hypothetical protein GY948_19995 [Alphaproteobacteria bacterium]|nr:hypothetical protein [Alphaproteobacteria bacterium]
MRNKLIALTVLIAALFAMASLPYVAAQNQTAKGLVEGMLQDILSSKGRRVLVDGVGIALDGDVTAKRVQVQDETGTWLVMEQFALDWQPLSLLTESLKINSLSVERLHVQRLPEAIKAEETADAGAPDELKNLQDAEIQKISVAKLELSEKVAGEIFIFSVDGSGRVKQTPAEVSFQLAAQRTNGGDSRLTANMLLDPLTRVLKVDLQLKEGRDGLVVNLLDIANQPAVDLDVSAQGSIDNWAGKFGLKLNSTIVAQGTAKVDTTDAGKQLTLDAEGEIGRLVSDRFAGWLGGSTQLVGSVLFEKDKSRAQVQRIRIGNTNVQLRASGPIDWSGETSDLAVGFRSTAQHPLLIAEQAASFGKMEVSGLNGDLNVTGSISDPTWQFKGTASAMTSEPAVLNRIKLDLRGQGVDLEKAGTGVNGSLSADVTRGNSNLMPAALLGPLRAKLAARTDQQGQIVISDTNVSAGVVNFALNGNLKPSASSFALAFRASASSPVTGYALLDGLLAGDARLSGRFAGNGEAQFSLSDWQIDSSALSLTLNGKVDETVDLTVAGRLSDLSQLHPEAGGGAELKATLSGDRAAPLLNLVASGESITLTGAALTDAALSANMKLSESAPSGQLDFSAKLQGQPVTARALLATTPEGTRQLREFSMVSGSARLNGSLNLPVLGGPSGTFKLTAPDLSDIGPLLLTRLRGSLNSDITLADTGGETTLKAIFKGADIASEEFTAATMAGDMRIEDALGSPRIEGQAKLRRVRAADLFFDAITATATSKGERAYALNVDVKGRDLSGRALADVEIAGDQTVIRISRLKGSAQRAPFALANPFTITRNESGSVSVQKAAVRIGKGRIKIDGQILPELEATVALNALPLSPFRQLAGIPGLSGTLTGNAAMTGEIGDPTGRFELTGRNLSADQLRAQGLRALQLALKGRMENRQIALRGTATSGRDLSVSIQGQIDRSRAVTRLDVRASGKANARMFADTLADAGARISGGVGFDVRVRGTEDQPNVQGTLTLSNATVGDVDGRFIVTRANGRFVISQDRVQIVSFRGRTGKSGSVSASGTVGLDGPRQASIRVQVQNGVYADGTLVSARYDANLQLVGPLDGSPLLQGDIILKKTKVTLSEIPPSALKPLEVRHRRAPPKVLQQLRQFKSRSGGGGSDLRVNLRIVAKESISVSGRGVTALLGGGLNLTGTPSALIANGSFRLRRGTLKLLGQRLEFERGRLDFDRDLDPRLNLVAVSRTSDSTIRLIIAGRASAPKISVTSSPELPEEEALARLVFNRDLLQLSPLQIAQLAASIAVLSGGSDSSLLGDLQDTLGVDWLEVTETASGETAVGAGKQINERLSIGVEQTTKTNTSRVIIDLGIGKNFKLRGAAGSDGSSRAGVFFEKDY